MKKVISAALAGALTLSLAACSSAADSSSAVQQPASEAAAPAGSSAASDTTEDLTLILRSGTYADVIKQCLPEFEKENNVKCEVLELSEDDLHSKIALDAANKDGAYDLCMVDGSWMAEFTANDVLANLSQLGYTLDDDIIPATTTISYYNNDVYLAPYYGNVTVLLYNKANVQAAGYDADSIQSLDDMLKICQQAAKNGQKGFVYRGDSANNTVVDFLPILLSYGGWVLDENDQPAVNSDAFKQAMNFYLELIATGDAEVKDDLIASVDTGAGTMGIGWPGWYVPTADSAADYCAITGAAAAGDKTYNANVYGVWTLGITANSTHKETTLKLLQYLMNPDVQLSTVENGGVPCRYSSLQNESVLAKYPQYKVVCQALAGGVYRPVIEQWTDFYTILGTEMSNIINGTKTVDQGLDDAQTQLEALMG